MSTSSISSPRGVTPGNEFDYRPIPMIAPTALAIGLMSALGFVTYLGLGLAVFGIILSTLALIKIRRSGGELGGTKTAVASLALTTLFLMGATAFHWHLYVSELPEGYTRVSFARDIAEKGLVVEEGTQKVHPDVWDLNGEKVLMKGYMFPERATEDLARFVLCKDNGDCCFGGQPDITDMVHVRLRNGLTADFFEGLVAVAGVFRIAQSRAGDLTPIYELECYHFSTARTAF